jgi:predicted esterase
LVIAVTPYARQWYPQPYSAVDQDEAVSGLPAARAAIEEVLETIERKYLVPRDKIALVGFSAGGVMAIDVAVNSTRELAGVVCHAGAVLEPWNIPMCRFVDMPIITTHCSDDDVFDWEERYLPMVESLENTKYNLHTIENDWGGHGVDLEDILCGAKILAPRLGYSAEWLEMHRDLYRITQ